jgi:hypothetical protein
VSSTDRRPRLDLVDLLCVVCVAEVMRRHRLRWFGHTQDKNTEEWVSQYRDLVVEGVSRRGSGRKTWTKCVNYDIKQFGLSREDAQDSVC